MARLHRLLLAAMALTAACRPEPRAEDRARGPGITLDRPEFSEAAAGRTLWMARAAQATYRAGPGVASLERVQATFFEEGRPVTRAEAPWASYDHAARDLRLGGGLTLRTLDGRAGVTARDARWDPASGRLVTSGGVAFWQGPNRLTAGRLWADRALRRVELRGRVRGTIALEPALLAGRRGGGR
ncbi:MAG: LPS export ABC transporter periplasmic protein LptC [Candidatus Sericytochromatia bacterium]|nr:LPS export ABC transporter periplasmic protein LptC [Candidatus Sericytochromatia bacterium]